MNTNTNWDNLLKDEIKKEYFVNILKFLDNEYKSKTIYPTKEDIYNALKYTPYNNVKVVILGQDPYHGPNQAHGLSFSVDKDIKLPPSLKNIYKELNNDLGIEIKDSGNLISWAKQGVLLLNTILTVEKGKPNSHKKIGWTIFTDKIIELLNERKEPIVFLLWGNNAIEKKKLITNDNHLVLTSPHPSPFSAYNGFFGCNHFSKTNEFLKSNNMSTIKW